MRHIKRVLAVILGCVVLVHGSSMLALAVEKAMSNADSEYNISSIQELSEEVKYQKVPYSTKISELNFPKYLEITIESEDQTATGSSASASSFFCKRKKIKVEWILNTEFSDYTEYNPENPGIYLFDAYPVDADKYEFFVELPQIEVEVMMQTKMMKASESLTNGWSYNEATSTVTIDSDEGLEDFKNNWDFETEIDSLYINKGVSEVNGLSHIRVKNLYIDCPYIAYMAFRYNDYIEYLEIGDNVEDIDGYAFSSCANLKRAVSNSYEDNLKRVNGYAFSFCDSLEYARLPASKFGGPVFQGCPNLEEVWLGLGNIVQEEYVTWDMFSGCSSLKKVWIGTNFQKIDSSMFDGCSSLEELWLLNKEAPVIDEGALDEVNQDFVIYTYPNSVSSITDVLAEKGYDFDVKIGVMCFFHTRESEYDQWEWEYNDIKHWKSCPYCGEIILEAEHSGGTATTTERAICEVCGQSYGELFEECQHSKLSDWKYDEEYHWKECLDCGEEVLKATHIGGTATETEQAICEVCGQAYGELLEKPECQHNNLSDWKYDTAYHWKECIDCSQVLYKEKHKGGSATETKQAICEVCGQPYGELLEEEKPNTDNDSDLDKEETGGNIYHSINGNSTNDTLTFSSGISGSWKSSINDDGIVEWRFIKTNGTMLYNTWAYIDNPYSSNTQPKAGWFYFEYDGVMQTGWKQIGEHWYFFHDISDGMLGTMQTGWLYDNDYNGLFYLEPDSGVMSVGWECIDGEWYFFETESNGTKGKLYIDTFTPDGYLVDNNGAWIKEENL